MGNPEKLPDTPEGHLHTILVITTSDPKNPCRMPVCSTSVKRFANSWGKHVHCVEPWGPHSTAWNQLEVSSDMQSDTHRCIHQQSPHELKSALQALKLWISVGALARLKGGGIAVVVERDGGAVLLGVNAADPGTD